MFKYLWGVVFLAACSPIVDTSERFAEDGSIDVKKSIEYLDKILEHDPDNANALYKRAVLELQVARHLKAKEDVVAALEEDPQNSDYLILKAKIDDKLGQVQEAINTVEFMLENNLPVVSVESQLFVSDLYLKVNNLSKSEYFLQNAASIASQFPEVLFQRARFYSMQHDTTKAMGFYHQLLVRDSVHEGGLLGLSEIYLKMHKPDSSLWLLAKIEKSKNYIHSILIAKSLKEKSLADSASYWWGQALLKSPRVPEAHYELGKYYYSKSNYTSARIHLASVSDEERTRFKDFDLLFARTNEMLSDTATADVYFQKAHAKDSTLPFHEKRERKTLLQVPDSSK